MDWYYLPKASAGASREALSLHKSRYRLTNTQVVGLTKGQGNEVKELFGTRIANYPPSSSPNSS